jgi:hypothetical protein
MQFNLGATSEQEGIVKSLLDLGSRPSLGRLGRGVEKTGFDTVVQKTIGRSVKLNGRGWGQDCADDEKFKIGAC